MNKFKECIVVCDKVDYIRCKYLKAICLDRLENYKECIEECTLLINEFFFQPNSRSFGKSIHELLYPKYALPNENAIYSLMAKCHRQLGHQFDNAKYLKAAFKLNSYDVESFTAIMQSGFDKTLSPTQLCTYSQLSNLSQIETCPSPASQIAMSINKRLSLENTSSPQKRPEPPKSSPRRTRTQTTATSTNSCNELTKKAFQRKLFDSAEENLANNQSLEDINMNSTYPQTDSELLFSRESFFCIFGAYLRKEYRECLVYVENLPEDSILPSTPLAYSLLGNIYYENLLYDKAKEYFELISKEYPHFLQEILYYSSTLWHLKDIKGLECLSKSQLESNRQSEVTWITTGNMYSAKKLSDSAIKCFYKAISLNPYCSYAYILMGYEHLSSEELSKSIAAFLESYKLNADYKSLFGISLVAMKECQWEKAEKYLLKASNLNSNNSVLFYYLGIIYESMERLQESCFYYSKSIELDSTNFTARFKRARLYYKMNELDTSLTEALALTSVGSSEPAIFLLLARIYKEMGDSNNSIKYFTWGTSLLSEFHALKKELESP